MQQYDAGRAGSVFCQHFLEHPDVECLVGHQPLEAIVLVFKLFEAGYGIRTVQELLGHANVRTTMIYTHVLNKGGRGVNSPLDGL
ncbi:tyrosine-type recombinase/integrase [Chitinibacteraceae bacterium HSL-7]